MVNVADAEFIEDIQEAKHDTSLVESDISQRKLKIATGILIGQSFGTSILPYTAMAYMQLPLRAQFHWTSQEFSWGVPFLFWFGALSLWPIGRMADKWGVRPVLLLGTIIVGFITLLMAYQNESLWRFYATYALLGIFGSTGVVYTKITAALFTQHRGKAMAILSAEGALSRAAIPLIINWLLLTQGWQTMYLCFAVVVLACVPILFFTVEEPGQQDARSWRVIVAASLPILYGAAFIYGLATFVKHAPLFGQVCYHVGTPSTAMACLPHWLYFVSWGAACALVVIGIGLLAYTLFGGSAAPVAAGPGRAPTPAAAPAPAPVKIDLPGMTIQQALEDWVFWLSTLAAFIGLFVFNGMFPHIVPALIEKGFSQTTIVWWQFVAMLLAFAGALAGGWAVDLFQTPKIAVPISLLSAVGAILTMLVSPHFGGVALLASILIASSLAFSAVIPMGNYFATRFFGLGSLTEIVATQFAVTNLFAGLSAPLFGWIFDTTHSYNVVFMITAGLNVVVALIWLVMPKYRFAANIGQMPAQAKT